MALESVMASVDLRKKLECSICLSTFKGPVTLHCGHSFCEDCITCEFKANKRLEDYMGRYEIYFCPECKKKFYNLYAFMKNINLCNMVECIRRQTNKLLVASGTTCSYCIDSPAPSLQYCLHCDASLCDKHLKVHRKSAKHVLTDPIVQCEIRKCSDHNKNLAYYCTEDFVYICIYCYLIGEHKGHKTIDKNKVSALHENLQTQPEHPDRTKRALTEISSQKAQLSLPVPDLIEEQKFKMAELPRKIQHNEEGANNMNDPQPDFQDSALVSSNLRKDLECSICLNIFKDPVTLRCGHNFCCDCLIRDLETHKLLEGVIFEMEFYFCPACKDKYSEMPQWVRNITLRNMAEHLLSHTSKTGTDSGTICTYCVDFPTPGVQSCVHCEVSLCGEHLKVHSTSAQHILISPSTSPEMSKCSDHNKILKYYCTEDHECICLYCCLIGEHKGHKTVTRRGWEKHCSSGHADSAT